MYPILSQLPVTVANEIHRDPQLKEMGGGGSLTKKQLDSPFFQDHPISQQNKMPVAPVLRSPGRIRAGSDTADHDRTLQRVSKSYVIPLSIGYM